MSEPPPTSDDLAGALIVLGGMAVFVVVIWALSKMREREYIESPEARAIRETSDPAYRFVVNQGLNWLTATPEALVVQPKVFGPSAETDLIIRRHQVRCIDFQRRKYREDRFNVYGHDGHLIVALASEQSSDLPGLLMRRGWPTGEELRFKPAPPGVDLTLPPIQWARYYDTEARDFG